MDSVETSVSHSGVKGMKWGIWNEDTKARYLGTGRQRTSNPKRATKERLKERRKADEYSSLLSDKELDRRIKRLEKEKRLRELTASEVNPGKKATNEFLAQNGKKIAAIVVGAIAVELGKQIVAGSAAKREARSAWTKERYANQLKRNDAIAEKIVDTTAKKASVVGRVAKNVATGNGIIPLETSRPANKTLAYKTGRVIGKVIDAGANTRATYRAQKGKHVRW